MFWGHYKLFISKMKKICGRCEKLGGWGMDSLKVHRNPSRITTCQAEKKWESF